MSDAELCSRITTDVRVMAGEPVIRGTRLTVAYILDRLAHGDSVEDIVTEYPGLETADIAACTLFQDN